VKRIVFNGKFLTVAPTGVHRVAEELIHAFERLPAVRAVEDCVKAEIIAPKTAERTPVFSFLQVFRKGFASGSPKELLWEQVNLPWFARKARLVNLCNLGPVLHPDSLTMIHDAQVYLTPASYSPGFRLWYKLVQPLLGRTSRRILTVSEYSKEQLVRFGVAPAEKITVIHNGCDHMLACRPDEDFVIANRLERGRYVLALASTQAHKNIRILLEAFSDEQLADMTLVLFGSAGQKDIEKLGVAIPRNVHFVGRVSDAQLAALMIHALAFACPSTTEGFGLPPLEAMILGCPAVVAPCGALPEACGEAALMADPHDAGHWVEQIRRLADNADLSARMRDAGRRRAEMFTWKRAAEKLALLLGVPDMPTKARVMPENRVSVQS
jgi:glycosyltransferase involved in cell wall biosynthesis